MVVDHHLFTCMDVNLQQLVYVHGYVNGNVLLRA